MQDIFLCWYFFTAMLSVCITTVLFPFYHLYLTDWQKLFFHCCHYLKLYLLHVRHFPFAAFTLSINGSCLFFNNMLPNCIYRMAAISLLSLSLNLIKRSWFFFIAMLSNCIYYMYFISLLPLSCNWLTEFFYSLLLCF